MPILNNAKNLLLCILFIAAISATLITFSYNAITILTCRSSITVYQTLLVNIVFLTLTTTWITAICKSPPTRLPMFATSFFVAIFVTKLAWCLQFDSYQPSDIGRYWRYGGAIAENRNDIILAELGDINLPTYVSRAAIYPAPLFWLFGKSNETLELANILLQLSTLFFFFLWQYEKLGPKPACISLPFFTFYPDNWFGTTLASHDLFALFLISCLFLVSRKIETNLCRSPSVLRAIKIIAYTLLLGSTTQILDTQRGYGIFIFATITFVIVANLLFNPRELILKTLLTHLVFLSFAFVAGWLLTSILLQNYALPTDIIKSPKPQPLSSYISAVASSGDGSFTSITPWRWNYPSATPESHLNELLARKIAWEKFGATHDFWLHIVRKLSVLAISWRTAEFAFCNTEIEDFNQWDIAYHSLLINVCASNYCLLLFLFLIRLLFIRRLPIHANELPVWCLSFAFFAPLLLLTEVLPTYDQVFVFLLSSNAGILVTSATRIRNGKPNLCHQSLRKLSCLLFIGVLFFTHWLTGTTFNKMGLTFAMVKSNGSEAKDRSSRPIKIAIQLPANDAPTIDELVISQHSFTLKELYPSHETLKFFVSAGHEEHGFYTSVNWRNCPYTWRLKIDDEEVAYGKVSDAKLPKFFIAKLPKPFSQPINCTIEVRTSEDWSGEIEFQGKFSKPTLTFEYFH
jgi:hypothetical protein